MTQSNFGDDGNDGRADKLVTITRSFVEDLHERVPQSHAEQVINSNASLRGDLLHQLPERFIQEHLIRDIAEEVLDYEYRPEPKGIDGLGGRIPDFEVMNAETLTLGEIKKPNNIEQARSESHKYIQMASSRPAIGISTDGWTWILHVARSGEGPIYHSHQPLRPIIRELGREVRHSKPVRNRKLREKTAEFVRCFHRQTLNEIV